MRSDAQAEEGDEAVAYLLQLPGILLVGVFQVLEGAGGIHIVARVDAHLLHILGGHVGHAGVEVYVGHERHVVSVAAQGGVDVAQVLGLFHPLGGEAHVFAAGVHDAFGLRHASVGVLRGGVGHALQAYGVASPHGGSADVDHRGLAAGVVE